MKAIKKAIQPPKSIPLRLSKKIKTKIKPKTKTILNIISTTKKVTILTNIPKSQKTCGGFGNFHIDY